MWHGLTPEQRFWGQVRKDGPLPQHNDRLGSCWVWSGWVTKTGYGDIKFQGKHWRVHRLSWLWVHGSIPEGKDVLHQCDNRTCVRPTHLYIGGDKENTLDAYQRGRKHYKTGVVRGAGGKWCSPKVHQ